MGSKDISKPKPWEKLEAGTWKTRFWLRGFITAGGHLPPAELARLWGPDGLPTDEGLDG